MKIAIIGTGVMGRGWITQCAMTGNEVHCFDADRETLEATIPFCEKLAGSVAKRFKVDDPDFSAKTVSNITTYRIPAVWISTGWGKPAADPIGQLSPTA